MSRSRLLVLTLWLSACGEPTLDDDLDHDLDLISQTLEELPAPDKTVAPKLDATLLSYYEGQPSLDDGEIHIAPHVAADADGRVWIDAVAAAGHSIEQLTDDLESLDFEATDVFENVVSGRIPLVQLGSLSAVPSLQIARHPHASTLAGAVPNDGDIAQRTQAIREIHGITGTGQRIGVISDSFNCHGGHAADAASGDLPSKVVVLEENDDCTGVLDEGRAMLQIVHDVAPDARLLFSSGFNGEASFANAIRNMVDAGATVIVDDVKLWFEPWFQQNAIQRAIHDVAKTHNTVYVTAAGNARRAKMYDSPFRPSSAPLGSIGISHDVDPGPLDRNGLLCLFPPGINRVFMQWDQPFRSVSGGQGATTDMDLWLLTLDGRVVTRGISANILHGDPSEFLGFINTGTQTLALVLLIVKNSGPTPVHFRLALPEGVVANFPTNSGGVLGHANAVEALTVGAANYRQTPPFGVSPPVIASYSSAGGTPILFDDQGNALGVTPAKPEIVGPDDVDTTFFTASGGDSDGDPFPNFRGTSASAPQIAGLAALLLQDQPWLRPGHVRKAIARSAVDMDDPITPGFDAGFDLQTGFGFADGAAALAYARAPLDLVPLDALLRIDRRVVAPFTGTDTAQAANLRFTAMGKLRDAQGTVLGTVWRIRNLSSDPDDLHFATLKSADGSFVERFRVPARTDTYALSTAASGSATHTLRYEKLSVFEFETATTFRRVVTRTTGTVATMASAANDFVDPTPVPATL